MGVKCMQKLIKSFLNLERKDKIIFFLLCTTIGNFFVAIIKFIFSIMLPSLWFFINAGFSFILGFSRLLTVSEYSKVRLANDEIFKGKVEYKNYLKNGIMLVLLRNNVFFY